MTANDAHINVHMASCNGQRQLLWWTTQIHSLYETPHIFANQLRFVVGAYGQMGVINHLKA
jgi:hypothetical protein